MKFLTILLFTLLLVGCRQPNKPVYTGYKNFRLQKAGIRSSTVAADLGLFNPNRYALQLKNADIAVWLNGKELGRILMDTHIDLLPKDTTYLPLRLEAPTKNMLLGGARMLLNSNVKVKLNGTVRAGRGGIFKNISVDYEGMQRLDFNAADTANLTAKREQLMRKS